MGESGTVADDAGEIGVHIIFNHFLYIPVAIDTHRFAGDPLLMGGNLIQCGATVVPVLAKGVGNQEMADQQKQCDKDNEDRKKSFELWWHV